MASCGRLLRKISGTAGGTCASRGDSEPACSRMPAGSAAPWSERTAGSLRPGVDRRPGCPPDDVGGVLSGRAVCTCRPGPRLRRELRPGSTRRPSERPGRFSRPHRFHLLPGRYRRCRRGRSGRGRSRGDPSGTRHAAAAGGAGRGPRRGTSGFLLADVLRRVLARCGADGRSAGARGDALEKLKNLLESAAPRGAAKVCGVDSAKIDALAETLAGGKKVVAIYDLEETAERAAGDLALLARIQMVTGHLAPPGGGLLLLGADGSPEGARLAAGGGTSLSDALSSGRIRGALIMLEDPFSDPEAVDIFGDLETLVVVDHFLTRTARAARVVLPASTLAETEGTIVRFDGRLLEVEKACQPPGGRTTAELIRNLAEEIGHKIPSARADAVRAELFRSLGISPADVDRAREGGRWPGSGEITLPRQLDIGQIRLSLQAGLPARRSYATMDGVVHSRLEGHTMRGAGSEQ